MTALIWLSIGAFLVLVAMAGILIRRLPLTASMIYLAVGVTLGPSGLSLLSLDLYGDFGPIELATEIAVIISLFGAGMKLRAPFFGGRWTLPVRLAAVSMSATVLMMSVVGYFVAGLSIGTAVLLGAILAPTDPVLASDVQIEDPDDPDELRFGLTGEAGLNDGMAFPAVMLGLGLSNLHEIGPFGLQWFGTDLVWAVFAGIGSGWVVGSGVGDAVIRLRQRHAVLTDFEEMLALGLIALSYGVASAISSYDFLAVFAAGLSLRRIEMKHTGGESSSAVVADAAHDEIRGRSRDPKKEPAYLVHKLITFNGQIERIGEAMVVVLIGIMLPLKEIGAIELVVAALLLFVIRPLSIFGGLYGRKTDPTRSWLLAWFGIRGIGSIYYLSYALGHGVIEPEATALVRIALTTVCVSIVLHGMSVTPLMSFYENRSDAMRR